MSIVINHNCYHCTFNLFMYFKINYTACNINIMLVLILLCHLCIQC